MLQPSSEPPMLPSRPKCALHHLVVMHACYPALANKRCRVVVFHPPLSSKHSGKLGYAGLNTCNDRPKPCKECFRGQARKWAAVNLSSLEPFVAHQTEPLPRACPGPHVYGGIPPQAEREREREHVRHACRTLHMLYISLRCSGSHKLGSWRA